jgi:FAD/FMN-containing dehydrogenase
MSGYRSTVGGALSQGSFFLGSTQYGTTADSVLGLEVVLADGSVVVTGSGGSVNGAAPTFRNYGPDITGLFLQDTGALGFKTRAVLKLIPFPTAQRFATFGFADEASAIAALSEVARAGLAAECYIWDPAFAASLRSRNSLMDDVRYLRDVAGSGTSRLKGLVKASRLVMFGKSVFESNDFLMHVTIDDVSEAGAEGRLKRVQEIGARYSGKPAEPSAPVALRARPFNDFAPMAEANAERRNVPTHGIFPHSRILAVAAEVRAFFDQNQSLMDLHGITQGTIVFAVGANAVCIEPLFFWVDEQLAAHHRLTDRSDLEVLERLPQRPPATEVVAKLRADLVELFTRHGASHCQIGKSYPYRQTRRPETYALLQAIKAAVDPRGLVNPGSLGLSGPG